MLRFIFSSVALVSAHLAVAKRGRHSAVAKGGYHRVPNPAEKERSGRKQLLYDSVSMVGVATGRIMAAGGGATCGS